MNWSDRFQSLKSLSPGPEDRRAGAMGVRGLGDIPPDATPRQSFRLQVEVLRITEQETRNGDPCYFFDLRDADGVRFPVVVWDWQMAKFGGAAAEGKTVVMDVRVPKEGFHSFTLA